jgi:hypothetical protein
MNESKICSKSICPNGQILEKKIELLRPRAAAAEIWAAVNPILARRA